MSNTYLKETQEDKLVENWLIFGTFFSTLRRVETLGSLWVMAPIPLTIIVTPFVQSGGDAQSSICSGELLHRATGDDQVWMCVNQWIWNGRLQAGRGVFTKTCLNRKRCQTKVCYLHCAAVLLGVKCSQFTLVFPYERTQYYNLNHTITTCDKSEWNCWWWATLLQCSVCFKQSGC